MNFELNKGYGHLLQQLKDKIRQAKVKVSHTANKQLLELYWEIGNVIFQQEQSVGWGSKIVENLARDFKVEFPDMTGFSKRNLRYMRDFSAAYPILQLPVAKLEGDKIAFAQPVVTQIPWTHHTIILDRVKAEQERLFYIQKTAENGWSKNVLALQIESNLYKRQGKTINNFTQTLPAYQSDLAGEMFKNPYLFDFLSLGAETRERDVEKALIKHLKKFMLELGRGFAYVGNQYNLNVEGDDYFLDLLFYNIRLHCYVVFELKVGDFKPEFAGKLNFYLNTVDGQIKTENDNPTIGILLCKTPNKTVVEYALRGMGKPMGVADYQLETFTPEQLGTELPTVQELEAELEKEIKVISEQLSPVQARLQALKEKLKNLKGDEIQTPATFPIIYSLYKEGLKPLYKELIANLAVINTEYQDSRFSWRGNDKQFTTFEQLDSFWEVEENTRSFRDFTFEYLLFGFKKAGTENYDDQLFLRFEISTYWYGFKLVNYNDGQPFLKRLYHQPLTAIDRQTIVDVVMTKAMDRIERIIEEISKP